jgi:hypothetical protein
MRRLAPSLLPLAVLALACGDGDGGDDGAPAPPIEVALASAAHVRSAAEATASLAPDLRGAGYRLFRLELEQPVDHGAPGGATFAQFATLLYRSRGAPVVLATNGYGASRTPTRNEVTALLGANQLTVEHRFFEPSAPDPKDWSRLTIEQAAADHHRVVQSLRPVLGGRWISTGASKGGMAAVYHRRFWPDDVDGTVAYVAPNSLSTSDPAYVSFLEAVGTPECREALKGFQQAVLAARDEIEPALEADAAVAGDGLTTFGVAKTLDYAVVEASFTFWQYGPGEEACSGLPAPGATAAELGAALDGLYGGPGGVVSFFGDAALAFFAPYFYQAATELGGPALPQDHLLGLLPGGVPADDLPDRYPPLGVDKAWNAAVVPDVMAWVASSGERLLFVYGGDDPWSARPFEPDEANDSFRYVVPGANHGASLAQIPEPGRAAAAATVRRWAGLPASSALAAEGATSFDPWALLEGERGGPPARTPSRRPSVRPIPGAAP